MSTLGCRRVTGTPCTDGTAYTSWASACRTAFHGKSPRRGTGVILAASASLPALHRIPRRHHGQREGRHELLFVQRADVGDMLYDLFRLASRPS